MRAGMSGVRFPFRPGWVNHLQWLMICLFENGLFTLVANRTHLSGHKIISIDYYIYYLVSENQTAVGMEVSLNFEVFPVIVALLYYVIKL